MSHTPEPGSPVAPGSAAVPAPVHFAGALGEQVHRESMHFAADAVEWTTTVQQPESAPTTAPAPGGQVHRTEQVHQVEGESEGNPRLFWWCVLGVAAAVSILGNGMDAWTRVATAAAASPHARMLPPIVASAFAALAPVALLVYTHGLAIQARSASKYGRPAKAVTMLVIALLVAGGFYISFPALTDLFVHAGFENPRGHVLDSAHVLAIMVDGSILGATAALLDLPTPPKRRRAGAVQQQLASASVGAPGTVVHRAGAELRRGSAAVPAPVHFAGALGGQVHQGPMHFPDALSAGAVQQQPESASSASDPVHFDDAAPEESAPAETASGSDAEVHRLDVPTRQVESAPARRPAPAVHRPGALSPVRHINSGRGGSVGALAVQPSIQPVEIEQRFLAAAEQIRGRRDLHQVALALQLKYASSEDLTHAQIAEQITTTHVTTGVTTVTRILSRAEEVLPVIELEPEQE